MSRNASGSIFDRFYTRSPARKTVLHTGIFRSRGRRITPAFSTIPDFETDSQTPANDASYAPSARLSRLLVTESVPTITNLIVEQANLSSLKLSTTDGSRRLHLCFFSSFFFFFFLVWRLSFERTSTPLRWTNSRTVFSLSAK